MNKRYLRPVEFGTVAQYEGKDEMGEFRFYRIRAHWKTHHLVCQCGYVGEGLFKGADECEHIGMYRAECEKKNIQVGRPLA